MDVSRWSRNQRTACQRCHARKVRCDAFGGQPCSGCRSSGTPCVAHEKRRRNRGPSRPTVMPMLLPSPSVSSRSTAGPDSAIDCPPENPLRRCVDGNGDNAYCESSTRQTIVAAMEPTPQLSPTRHTPHNAEEVGRAAAVLSSLSSVPRASAGVAAGSTQAHREKSEAAQNPTQDAGPDNKGDEHVHPRGEEAAPVKPDAGDGAKRHLVEMLSQEDIEDRVMQRGVRIVYVGQEYSNVHYLIRQRARRTSASVHHFPSNQISRKFTSHELDRIPREAFELPPKAVVDALLGAYFRHVHPGFPVLDKAAFMGQYRRRDPRNPLSLLVLQAVLMVGAHVYGDGIADNEGVELQTHQALVQDRSVLKAAFFRRAKMLYDARFEWNRDVVVQAALLMVWHSEGVEDIGANHFFWVGVAARTALGLGMHRDTRASTLIAHDKRLWRRLWWILVQYDVIVSLSYGRPQAINLAESDVPDLLPEELTDIGPDDDNEGSGIDADYLIHQTRLSCIIAQTLRNRYGLRTPPDRRRQALADADQQLAVWMAHLPPRLRCRPDGKAASSPWATMLHLTYNNFLILLHRPPPTPNSFPGATSQENMGICSAAAGIIVSLLEAVVARGELRFLNVFAVDALFTTLIQLSAEIRVANPILAGHAMQRFDSAMDILRRLAGIWLNAEIILRLFEDSSERTRAELLIGKGPPATAATASAAPAISTVGPPRSSMDGGSPTANMNGRSPLQPHQAPVTPGGAMLPMESLQSLILSSSAALQQQQQLVPMNEQLDWTSLYWENSGFASLSPFSDMPVYLSM